MTISFTEWKFLDKWWEKHFPRKKPVMVKLPSPRTSWWYHQCTKRWREEFFLSSCMLKITPVKLLSFSVFFVLRKICSVYFSAESDISNETLTQFICYRQPPPFLLCRWKEAHYRFIDSRHCRIANSKATNSGACAGKVNCPLKYISSIFTLNTNLS